MAAPRPPTGKDHARSDRTARRLSIADEVQLITGPVDDWLRQYAADRAPVYGQLGAGFEAGAEAGESNASALRQLVARWGPDSTPPQHPSNLRSTTWDPRPLAQQCPGVAINGSTGRGCAQSLAASLQDVAAGGVPPKHQRLYKGVMPRCAGPGDELGEGQQALRRCALSSEAETSDASSDEDVSLRHGSSHRGMDALLAYSSRQSLLASPSSTQGTEGVPRADFPAGAPHPHASGNVMLSSSPEGNAGSRGGGAQHLPAPFLSSPEPHHPSDIRRVMPVRPRLRNRNSSLPPLRGGRADAGVRPLAWVQTHETHPEMRRRAPLPQSLGSVPTGSPVRLQEGQSSPEISANADKDEFASLELKLRFISIQRRLSAVRCEAFLGNILSSPDLHAGSALRGSLDGTPRSRRPKHYYLSKSLPNSGADTSFGIDAPLDCLIPNRARSGRKNQRRPSRREEQ